MNKIFKVIWNPATGSYTVASETAKSRQEIRRSKLLISLWLLGNVNVVWGYRLRQKGQRSGRQLWP
ncbi:ESPR domain-containing protein [Escherichia coli]|nr:ESPR domain-containing protein [Escherichia coli]